MHDQVLLMTHHIYSTDLLITRNCIKQLTWQTFQARTKHSSELNANWKAEITQWRKHCPIPDSIVANLKKAHHSKNKLESKDNSTSNKVMRKQ